MKVGIYYDLDNDKYHSGEGVSKSNLDLVNVSPLHLRAKHDAANDNGPPSKALYIGTAFHALCLEPEVFAAKFVLELEVMVVASKVLDKLELKGDAHFGVELMKHVAQKPVRQIAENAGVDGAVALAVAIQHQAEALARALENTCFTVISPTVGEARWSPSVVVRHFTPRVSPRRSASSA